MNTKLRQISFKSGLICIGSLVVMTIYLFIFPPTENIWNGNAIVLPILMMTYGISLWVFIWNHIRCKGYSQLVSIIGLIIFTIAPIFIPFLIFLPDKFPIEY